ncbi:MAG TPA: cytochrome c [Opitutus sp.]|nr:cytochrome c [Opitutus sp.]
MNATPHSGGPPCLPVFVPGNGRQRRLPLRLLASAALLALAACDNMEHQANTRPLEPSSHLPKGASAQPPPAHTVARGSTRPGDVYTTGVRDGALTTALPVPLTRTLLERGRERFNIYCAICHGRDGYGRGIVVRRGFPPPPSYHEPRLRDAPIGHFFDVMTHGYGVMYSYADRVSVADRWAIAAYIRALQRSQHATPADVPADHRSELAAQ